MPDTANIIRRLLTLANVYSIKNVKGMGRAPLPIPAKNLININAFKNLLKELSFLKLIQLPISIGYTINYVIQRGVFDRLNLPDIILILLVYNGSYRYIIHY